MEVGRGEKEGRLCPSQRTMEEKPKTRENTSQGPWICMTHSVPSTPCSSHEIYSAEGLRLSLVFLASCDLHESVPEEIIV